MILVRSRRAQSCRENDSVQYSMCQGSVPFVLLLAPEILVVPIMYATERVIVSGLESMISCCNRLFASVEETGRQSGLGTRQILLTYVTHDENRIAGSTRRPSSWIGTVLDASLKASKWHTRILTIVRV
jgi:hypothetical protein